MCTLNKASAVARGPPWVMAVICKRRAMQQDDTFGNTSKPPTVRKTFIHSVALSAGFSCFRLQHDCDQMFYTFSLCEGTNTLFEILKKMLLFYSRKERENTISLTVHANIVPTMESKRDVFLYWVILTFSPLCLSPSSTFSAPQAPAPHWHTIWKRTAKRRPWVTPILRQNPKKNNLKLSNPPPAS